MEEGGYCATIGDNCTPNDCLVEFSSWRDLWAIVRLERLERLEMSEILKKVYRTNIEPVSTPPPTESPNTHPK